MKKIALPINSDNTIDGHFGHCEYYNIYTISDNQEVVEEERLKGPEGCGCKSNIAPILAQKGVQVMIAGGIGNGAVNVLENVGISVIRGCTGKADELVNQYLRGELTDSGVNCTHHADEDGGHTCSGHHH